MLIECPNCATEFNVPDSRVRPNLRLRCGRCATEWIALPEPVAEPPAREPPPEPDLDPDPDSIQPILDEYARRPMVPPAGAVRPHGLANLVTAWVVTLVVVATLGWATIYWRAPIMQAWPPATRGYAALGLT